MNTIENWWLVRTSVIQVGEWASELPNRTSYTVGFGEQVSSLYETNIRHSCLILLKRAEFSANKGGTTVPRPFWMRDLFVLIRKFNFVRNK